MQPKLAHGSQFMFEFFQRLMELSKLKMHAIYQQHKLLSILQHRFFCIEELALRHHMAHICLLYDDHKEQKCKVNTNLMCYVAIQQQYLCFQNSSKHLMGIHHCIQNHIQHRNMLKDLKMKFLSEEFVCFQCKFCHSLPRQLRKPSKIHKQIDLQLLQWSRIQAIVQMRRTVMEEQ